MVRYALTWAASWLNMSVSFQILHLFTGILCTELRATLDPLPSVCQTLTSWPSLTTRIQVHGRYGHHDQTLLPDN